MIKKIAFIGAVGAAGLLYFGKSSYDEYSKMLKNIKPSLVDFKIDSLGLSELKLRADVRIDNFSETSIDIPGQLLKVKTIHFYLPNGTHLGSAFPNLSDLQLQAGGYRILKNVPVQASTKSLIQNLSEVMEIASDPGVLKLRVELEAFNRSITVDA